MIGYIKGTVEETYEDMIILENSGIGYRVFFPTARCLAQLKTGEETKIYTYMNVREDGVSLFGFMTKDDLEAYKLLLLVSGVGPKAAMSILNIMDASELRMAVLTDDASKISKASGIGKKTAQKILLELKDRFSIEDIIFDGENDSSAAVSADDPSFDDAVAALVALGYSGSEALKAVKKAASESGAADTETLLKGALKHLF